MSHVYRTRTATAWLASLTLLFLANLGLAQTQPNCPTITFSYTATGSNAAVVTNQTQPASVTMNMRDGGAMAVSSLTASVSTNNLKFIERMTSNGNVIYQGALVELDREILNVGIEYFNRSHGSYTLQNSQTTGILSETFTPYIDTNNNNQFDPATECLGTPTVLVYNILPACPTITLSYAMTGCTNSIVLSNTTSSGSPTIALCSGGTMAVGPVSTSVSVSTLRLLNKVTSNGNIIFQGRTLETNRSIIDVSASDYFNRSYGPYGLINPQVTGTISETFTPYIDQNGDGQYNADTECLGQPLTLFYTIAPPTPQAPTNGLVAHYPFNGNANDESGNGRNGTVNGATLTTDRFGVVNKAYDFDGVNDNIVVSHHASLNSSDFTYSLWTRATEYGSASIDPPTIASLLMAKYGGSQGYVIYQNSVGKVAIRPHPPGSTTEGNNFVSTQSALINGWTHVTFAKQGQAVRVYINGTLSSSGSYTTSYVTSSSPLYIGSGPWQWDEYFKGQLDDIRIYNRGLSDSEVAQIYQAEASPTPPTGPTNGLIAYYPFNGNANDGSGNNNNGTVQGATLVPDRRGTPNGAYRFADGNKIVVANSASLTLNNAYSFSGWFNLRSFTGRDGNGGGMSATAGVHTIFSKNCDRDRLFFMVLPSPDGIPRMNFASGTWASGLSAFRNLNLNTWIHVAHVHSNNQSELYINGVMAAASGGRLDFAASNQQDLIIGGMNCWPYFFNGELDDLRFYNRGLSHQEVKDIFIAENGPIQSIKTGSWLDPTTWSCNCLPTNTNPVEVKHVVTIPAAQTGSAYSLKYGVGGRVDMGSGAKVVLVEE